MGGINSKVSPYIVGVNEFTKLVNVDFQMPGSLTKRWGSTMYVGTTLSTKIVGLYEFIQNNNAGMSQVIAVGQSTAYKATGFSLTAFFNFFGFTTFIGGTDYSSNVSSTYVSLGYTYYIGGTFWYDFENYANYLWACNGTNFWKYDGSSYYFFSLPTPITTNKAIFTIGSSGVSGASGGMTGFYYYAYGYQNIRGYFGTPTDVGTTAFSDIFFPANPAATQGATNVVFAFGSIGGVIPGTTYGIDVGYGITSIAIYRSGPHATTITSSQLTYTRLGLPLALNGLTYVDSNQVASATLMPSAIAMEPTIWFTGGAQRKDVFDASPTKFNPKYIEVYNNQMFFSGFDYSPSVIWFSDIGEPESIQPEFNFEVRTNDGDTVRGMKSYLSALLLFKTNSFHRLSGQDPNNFALVEISAQYGCISNRAICVAKNTCYFLDRKGVIAFNGANIDIISNKIDSIFQRMNYQAALDQATMIYDKVRNQILIEIPIDGSATNNFTIVYDIIVEAWTTYEGISASSSTIVKGSLPNFSYLYGTYNGAVLNVGSSYLSDNGTAYTALIQTRFFNEIDPATTKQWRRIFFNVDAVIGSTVTVNLIPNYGSSVSVTRSFQQTPYLSRIDFGIPSTALSFTLSNYSAVDTLRLHGFTMEYRFQRNVQDIE